MQSSSIRVETETAASAPIARCIQAGTLGSIAQWSRVQAIGREANWHLR